MLLRPFYGRLFFSPDGDSGGSGESGGDQANADGQQQDETSSETTSEGTDEAPTALAAAKANNARLDQLLKNTQRDLATLKTADQKRTEDAAKKQGNFEKLYETAQTTITERDARIVELEGQIAEGERATRRQAIAAKHRLTAELADRLRGDTDDELEADAKSLARLIRIDAPDTEAGRGGRRSGVEQKPVTPGKTVDGTQKVAWTAGT